MARVRVGACLSLSGPFAGFGRQAAAGLRAWQRLDGDGGLILEDDRGDPDVLAAGLRRLGPRCDVLLGPYSTRLMRAAGPVAAEAGWLIWNHGGAGDDVQAAHPGHVVSVLTPASRYAEPFLRLVAGRPGARLRIVHGRGSFGRQVAAGAAAAAGRLRIAVSGPAAGLPEPDLPSLWDLLTAGTFEEDVETVRRARALPRPPRLICAVAAGVREFGRAAAAAEGVFGLAQWFPGAESAPALGPAETEFLAAYPGGAPEIPDYPAVQAAAAAVIAAHCVRQAHGTGRDLLWPAAAALDTRTLFGAFRVGPDGVQAGHQTTLTQWTASGLAPA